MNSYYNNIDMLNKSLGKSKKRATVDSFDGLRLSFLSRGFKRVVRSDEGEDYQGHDRAGS